MAKRKQVSSQQAEINRQYNKERNRLKRAIKSAEKRGYLFSEKALKQLIPEKPKKISEASIRRLRKIKTPDIYEKAVAYSEETGEKISGKRKRAEERKKSARKAQQTRKYKQAQVFVDGLPIEERDEEQKRRLQEDVEYRNRFTEGSVMYDNIVLAILHVKRTHRKAGEHLHQVLHEEIEKYGFNETLMAMGTSPGEVERILRDALNYNPGHEKHDSAISAFRDLIKGYKPSPEEVRRLYDMIDSEGQW